MAISKTGFSISCAGSAVGTAFGLGSYFAECSSKSDEYAKAGSVSRVYDTSQALDQAFVAAQGHKFAMILCRVCLGNATRITNFDKDGHKRVLGTATSHDALKCRHDFLLGDREAAANTYREFVIYDGTLTHVAARTWGMASL